MASVGVAFVLRGGGLQQRPEQRAVTLQHAQLARLRFIGWPCACRTRRMGRKQLFAQQVEAILVVLVDEAAERPREQRAARHAQHGGGGEVGLSDQPGFAEGDIAHRGQVVEREIARPLDVQRHLRLAQLLVLQLQLDLVYAQVVQHRARGFGRQRIDLLQRRVGLFPEGRLGPLAQRRPCLPCALSKCACWQCAGRIRRRGRAWRVFILAGHGAPPVVARSVVAIA